MVTLLNKKNQPVTVNLGKKKSLHFLAKQAKVVTFEEFQCQEVKEKIDSDQLVVMKMESDY